MKKNFYIPVLFFLCCSQIFSQGGWFQQQSGTTVGLNKIFFINENTGWIVGDSGKILKTINGGGKWFFLNSNTTQSLRSIYFLNELTGYAAGGNYTPLPHMPDNYKIILKTIDGGNTWAVKYFIQNFDCSLSDICFINLNTGFASGFGGNGSASVGLILKTTNTGNNWIEYPSDSNFPTIQFTDPNTGWLASNFFLDVGGDSIRILRSSDGGNSWVKVFTKPRAQLNCLYFINNNTGWAAGFNRINGNHDMILKTIDGGNNWQIFDYASLSFINSIFFPSYDTGWYCSRGIYKSTNNGIDWVNQIPPNSIDHYTFIYFANNLTGWSIGTNGKILKTITGGLTSINNSNEITPIGFLLYQNFPNPFNPSTIIRYDIPFENKGLWHSHPFGQPLVLLKVYDILGNEVATLVNEKQSVTGGAGSYTIEFNGENYPSGVYFYHIVIHSDKLETDNPSTSSGQVFSEVKKMILLK